MTSWAKGVLPIFALGVAGILLVGCSDSASKSAEIPDVDPLASIGVEAMGGTAEGFIPDDVCGRCHQELWTSFQSVGMAQSLKAPQNARPIERLGETYYHEASQRYYEVNQSGDGLSFRRYQHDSGGRRINELQLDVDWVVGSGNRARSYLHQNERGELFMLPISWYAENAAWRMSPGFETARHEGISRKIRRPCMFCHNALPELETGADAHLAPDVYPQTLPEGIGCQRCHGPGADHVRSVLAGGGIDGARATIVNPARLDPERRDSVCFQCHMLPSEVIEGVRRFGTGDMAFRAGDKLNDKILNVDVATREDRFEINHHGYRLHSSRCYQESDGRLACISCHDPHVKPASQDFRREVSSVCLECHTPLPQHSAATASSTDDCAACHMPSRRTDDVVEATMTDHRIATGPFDANSLVAAKAPSSADITGLDILDFGVAGSEDEVYRYVAALRADRFVEPATNWLENHLDETRYDAPTAQLDLLRAQLQLGRFREAETTSRELLDSGADFAVTHALRGMAHLALGDTEASITSLRKALALDDDPETRFNLAVALLQDGRQAEALVELDAGIQLRPTLSAAWKYKGIILVSMGDRAGGRDALIEALRLDPADSRAYRALVDVLFALGQHEDARRFLDVGRRVSDDPDALALFD